MNYHFRLAITSRRQICILNMSNITANRIAGAINIATQIQSAVYSLAWHPEKANTLAFGTKEGRVRRVFGLRIERDFKFLHSRLFQIGIVNINKPTAVVYMRPTFASTVYSITWGTIRDPKTQNLMTVLICCANEKIIYFAENGDPIDSMFDLNDKIQ
jgi:hypothetical protein